MVEGGRVDVVASRQGSRQFDPELALTLESDFQGQVTAPQGGLGGRGGILPFRGAGIVEAGASSRGRPTLRSRPRADREGPGTDRAAEGAESRGGSTLHHRGPHRRERPQGDSPDQRQPRQGSMATHPGVYCLRSNQTWDEESLWRTFRGSGFSLPERPSWACAPSIITAGAVEGHLFLTVIAYQLVQVIRKRLKQRGDSSSWTSILETAAGYGERADLALRKATRAETDQKVARRSRSRRNPKMRVSTRL